MVKQYSPGRLASQTGNEVLADCAGFSRVLVLSCLVLSFARGNCASDLHSGKEAHTAPLSRKTAATEVRRLAIQAKNGTDATCHNTVVREAFFSLDTP